VIVHQVKGGQLMPGDWIIYRGWNTMVIGYIGVIEGEHKYRLRLKGGREMDGLFEDRKKYNVVRDEVQL
jgi:hypothetical protein